MKIKIRSGSMVVTIALLSACTIPPATVVTAEGTAAISSPSTPAEVVPVSRYTLVSLVPDEALKSPLRQIASRDMPARKNKTITRGDGLRVWLSGTGYGLCLAATPELSQFFASPLPEVQRVMGPLRAEDALHVIAGVAWHMTTDEVTRTVCFQRNSNAQLLS